MDIKIKLNGKKMFKLPNEIIVNGKRYENTEDIEYYIGLGNEKVFSVDALKNNLLKKIDDGEYILIKSRHQLIEEVDLHNNSVSVEVKVVYLTEDTRKIIFEDLFHPVQPIYYIDSEKYKLTGHNVDILHQYITVKKVE
jgi:hypothetical protein